MKIGSTIDIYAAPLRTDKHSTFVDSIIDVSGFNLIPGQEKIILEISRASKKETLFAFGGSLDGLEDLDNTLRFSVKVNRPLVVYYMNKVRADLANRGFMGRRSPGGTNGVVFIGMLFRDFRNLVYLIIILSNIAHYKCFPIYRTAYIQFGKKSALDRCSVGWANRPQLREKVGIKQINLNDLLKFTLFHRDDFIGTPSRPYMKALAHYSYLYNSGPRLQINNLIWCLGAIEALLNPGGRSVRAQMEDRLRILFEEKFQSFILTNFKALYEYRSKLTHGSLKVPFYLHDKNNTPFLDIPFEEAEFAMALSVKLLQICFDRKTHDLNFRLILVPP